MPGIAGIMEIVEEHTPDESALDPEHPYYDPKSTAEKPRWDKVRVLFRRKFPELIKLKELQMYAKEGGILQNLQTLKQSRLSVSKVSKKEWDFIMDQVGDEEPDEPPELSKENDSQNISNSNGAGQLDPSAFGPGEGGVLDGESNLATAWTTANLTCGM